MVHELSPAYKLRPGYQQGGVYLAPNPRLSLDTGTPAYNAMMQKANANAFSEQFHADIATITKALSILHSYAPQKIEWLNKQWHTLGKNGSLDELRGDSKLAGQLLPLTMAFFEHADDRLKERFDGQPRPASYEEAYRAAERVRDACGLFHTVTTSLAQMRRNSYQELKQFRSAAPAQNTDVVSFEVITAAEPPAERVISYAALVKDGQPSVEQPSNLRGA